MRINKDEDGQAIVLVALAMSIFLLGAVGLAIDGAHLYAQRQMAQTAADAAAQAGIMSIYNGTATFSTTSAFTCTTTDTSTPCKYASNNGFGGSAVDTVVIDYPGGAAAPGVALSAADSPNLIRATVSRNVSTTLMRLLGPSVTSVKATAIAAIVNMQSAVPMLITDPSNANTLSMNGNTITICGGPNRSIEVNSSNASAYGGGGSIDLSHAGPADPGDCSTGTGADFAVDGGSTSNPGNAVNLGSTGHYVAPASPTQDPLANVPAPTAPAAIGITQNISQGTDGCTNAAGCVEYSPGLWNALAPGASTVIFKPGLYYVQGGGVNFTQTIGGGTNNNAMCVGCAADPNTGNGMVIYDTVAAGTPAFPASRPTGGFNIGTTTSLVLQGAGNTTTNANGQTVPAAPYYGILFWEDRTANTQNHILGQSGGGCFNFLGTIYITNTLAIMQADSTHVQSVNYGGAPCSATVNQGEIIVGQLTLNGTVPLKMFLYPYGFLNVRQVALVN